MDLKFKQRGKIREHCGQRKSQQIHFVNALSFYLNFFDALICTSDINCTMKRMHNQVKVYIDLLYLPL